MAIKIYKQGSGVIIDDGVLTAVSSFSIVAEGDIITIKDNESLETWNAYYYDIQDEDGNQAATTLALTLVYLSDIKNPRVAVDYMLDVQRGKVTGQEVVTILGRSASITTANNPEDVWMAGGLYHNPNGLFSETARSGFLTSASTLSIVSSSANDTAAGTGARKITLVGIDTNGLEITEDIILNGLTPVVTVKQYKAINFMFISRESGAAGSLQWNDGDISCYQTGTATNILSYISAQHSYAQNAAWTIPVDETWYMIGVDGGLYDSSISANRGVMTFMELKDGIFSRYFDFNISTESTPKVDVSDRFVMESGSQWVMRVLEVASNGCSASFNGVFLRVKN